jgi:hypothetical protein
MGPNHVTIDLARIDKRVVLGAPVGVSRVQCGMAAVYGVGLLVAAQALDWPDANEVEIILAATSSQPRDRANPKSPPYAGTSL